MKKSIIYLVVLLLSIPIYGQENPIYIIFNKSENTYSRTILVTDTLELRYFQINKNIPKESYIYSLSLDNQNNLIWGIKGSVSWNNEGKISILGKAVDSISKGNIILNKKNSINTNQVKDIEFETLRNLLDKLKVFYILINKDNYYKVYKKMNNASNHS